MVTLVDRLRQAADEHGQRLFVRFAGRQEVTTLTYGDAWALASRWSASFRERGVRPGEPVVMALPNTADFVGAYFGALLCGAIPAPAAPLRSARDEHYPRVLADRARFLEASVLVVPADRADIAARAPWSEARGVHVVTSADLPSTGSTTVSRGAADDVAHLQFTSGTSGRSKAAQLTHRALLEQCRVISSRLRIVDREHDRAVSWLPLYHDMGLIGFLLTPLYHAGEVTLLATEDFILRPTAWVKALSDYRATITGAPCSGYAITARRLKDPDIATYDLSPLRIALCGAETVRAAPLREFGERLAVAGLRKEAFLPTYGLAENGLAVTMPEPLSGAVFDRVDAAALAGGRADRGEDGPATSIAALGRAMDDVMVEIRGEDGALCGDRVIGEIVVRSTSLASGYFRDRDATAAVFRGGALWTGDLGYTVDGVLHMTGRKKELMIIGGRNYFPDDLEAVVVEALGTRIGKVVALAYDDGERATEAIAILIESAVRGDERDALRLEARTSLIAAGFPVSDVRVVPMRTIPSTQNGKVQRVEARRLYLAKELSA